MHVPPHLTPAALVRRFPPITDIVPEEQRKLVGSGDSILYFSYIGEKGGCFGGGHKAKQWIMITTSRVSYRAAVGEVDKQMALVTETAGSILLPQISYVGSRKSSGGCAKAKTYNVVINSSGGSIVVAMPTEAEMKRVQAFLEAVLQPT